MAKPMTGVTKRAWIRDPGQPMGRPGTGRIGCPCGNAPASTFGNGQDVLCGCGLVYDSRGWLKRDLNAEAAIMLRGSTLTEALACVCPDGDGCGEADCLKLRAILRVKQ